MTIKELKEKRAALLAEVEGADEKRFAEIKGEVERINYQISELGSDEETRNAEEERAAELRAAREPSGNAEEEETPGVEKRSKGKVVLFDSAAYKPDAELSKADALRFAKSAFGKQVRSMLTDTELKLSKNEKRALGVAITTTSEAFTAATEGANGINNGGVFIPQSVLYDLLDTDAPESPFLRDVGATHIKGALIFPYVEEETKVGKGKAEGVAADDRAIKWGKLSLAQGNYPITIEVTMELLSMTDEEFADYLLADLSCEINTVLAEEVLYGTGKDDRIAGVSVGAIAGEAYAAGAEADAIKVGLLALSRRARKGAKVYISRSMSLAMAFEKDDNGRYIFPIYNGTGITSIATIPVEVDENLKDGDFVIGNAKNYKLNFTKQTEIYPEVHGKTRVIEYTAHLMVAGKAAPKKFYYGKKTEAAAAAE